MKPLAIPRMARSLSAAVLLTLVAVGCGAADDSPTAAERDPATTISTPGEPTSTDPATTPAPDEARVVSAEEGVSARAQFTPLQRSESATESLVVGDSAADCATEYVPSPEEVAESNEATNGLIEAFDRFGIAYVANTDDNGYVSVEYAYDDVVAQSVADSYWQALYPPEPIPQEELDAVIEMNDILAERFDAAGVVYTRAVDEFGWESFEYDYEDPAAQAAAEEAWAIISPPQPPTAEDLAWQDAENTRLMAAFDDAGIEYELVTDELGWAWVEWDSDDPETADRYVAIIDELYPPIAVDPIEECMLVDESIAIDEPASDEAVAEPIEAIEPAVVDGPTPEQIATRDAEVAAMATGFAGALVDHEVVGESPWQTVVFDIANDAAVPVVASVLAARG